MSYRQANVSEIVEWLLANGFAEEKPGYGHVDAQTLAEALDNRFDIMTYAKDPK